MRLWHVFLAVAVVAFTGGVLNHFSITPNADPSVAPGAFVATVVFGILCLFFWRRAAADDRMDQRGPVAPAEDPAVPEGTRWTLDQIAAVLALHVEPMNGLVFADERTGTIRVMVDPPSAITWNPGTVQRGATAAQRERMRGQGSSGPTPYFTGHWTRIRMGTGRLPSIKDRHSTMSVGYNHAGVFVPWWSSAAKDRLQADQSALSAAGSRTPVSFEYDSRELHRVVDSTAVRAGWVSAAAADARPAPEQYEIRRVERTAKQSSTTRAGSGSLSEAEREARLAKARRQQAKAAKRSKVDPSVVMTVIGAAILVGCVVGTILGLVFGMPWWASFIIIGSGLLFCVLFVLPVWLLMGKPWGAARS